MKKLTNKKKETGMMRMFVGVGMAILLLGSNATMALDSVPVSEIRAKLCPVDVWYANQGSITPRCAQGDPGLSVQPGEAVVSGFLMLGNQMCYLPCDFTYFYN